MILSLVFKHTFNIWSYTTERNHSERKKERKREREREGRERERKRHRWTSEN